MPGRKNTGPTGSLLSPVVCSFQFPFFNVIVLPACFILREGQNREVLERYTPEDRTDLIQHRQARDDSVRLRSENSRIRMAPGTDLCTTFLADDDFWSLLLCLLEGEIQTVGIPGRAKATLLGYSIDF